MAKWADYLISAVRYNQIRTRIEQVRVHRDDGESIGQGSAWTRAAVIESIEDDGKAFCTIRQGDDGKYRRGADVHVATVDGEKFLRTDRNAIKKDNLGELPEF